MSRIFVKPAHGLIVRNPDKIGAPPIKEDGEWMERNQYVLRRLRDGDLVACDPPAPATSTPAATGDET